MYRKTPTPAPAGGMAPPASVAKIPAALGFWERTAPILIADGRLAPDRVDAFAILCHLHSEIEQLAATVATEGWITATDKGQAASPVAKLLRDSRRDFVQLARDFGLTAAAAARIPQELPSGEEEGDEEDAVLAKLSLRT
jgi:P27 family predicted phage terminase small subunit